MKTLPEQLADAQANAAILQSNYNTYNSTYERIYKEWIAAPTTQNDTDRVYYYNLTVATRDQLDGAQKTVASLLDAIEKDPTAKAQLIQIQDNAKSSTTWRWVGVIVILVIVVGVVIYFVRKSKKKTA